MLTATTAPPPTWEPGYAETPTTTGNLTSHEKWSGEVVLTGSVTVDWPWRLVIEPGTVVKVPANAYITINSLAFMIGRDDSPVVLEAADGDDTWGGIQFGSNAASSIIRHAVISGASTGIYSIAGQHLITDSLITGNETGIYVYSGAPSISNNLITANSGYGIRVQSNASIRPFIQYNTIDLNGGYGIFFSYSYSSETVVENNIITRNNTGIYSQSGNPLQQGYNNVWHNGSDYSGLSAADTDISSDPQYMDSYQSDLRLVEGSPSTSASSIGGELGAYGNNGTPPTWEPGYAETPTTTGNLTSHEKWSGEVVLTGSVTVDWPWRLVIEPGTVVKVPANAYITINSLAFMIGRDDSPVVLEAADGDDTWGGIQFGSNAASSIIRHAVISGASTGIYSIAGQHLITDSLITGNETGIYVYSGAPSISNNLITANSGYGINVRNYSSIRPFIQYNTIDLNGGYGIFFSYSFSSDTVLENNIITRNNVGIYNYYDNPLQQGYNNVWHNGTDYTGLSPADTDISSDPLYIDDLLHLAPASPSKTASAAGGEIGRYGGTSAVGPPGLNPVTPLVSDATQVLSGTKHAGTGIMINGVLMVAVNDDSQWSAEVNLTEGVNRISVFAVDSQGERSIAISETITRDSTPPQLMESDPAHDSLLTVAINQVDLVIRDVHTDVDFDEIIDRSWLSGTNGGLISGTWSHYGDHLVFTADSDLLRDTYTMVLHLVDTPLGNTTTFSLRFTIDDGTQGPPAGPVFSNLQFDDAILGDGAILTRPGSIQLDANDPNGISRIEFMVDGVLIGMDNNGSSHYAQFFDIEAIDDGAHVLEIKGYDSLGNESALSLSITVDLAPPAPPILTSPLTGLLTNQSRIIVQGTAEEGSQVMVFNNNAQIAGPLTLDSRMRFSTEVFLDEGVNSLQVAAENRGGTGDRSQSVVVTLDTSIPDSPTHLAATTNASGVIRLSWNKPLDDSIKGYNLYRSDAAFETAGEATKLNTDLLLTTTYNDLPATDGEYFYRASAVSYADNESFPSNMATGISDRVAPEAVSIEYMPTGAFDEATGRMGPGLVSLTLTVSEPLLTTPFLSINPVGAIPLTVDLRRQEELVYTGWFVIDSNTPTGTAYAVFSARDAAGNRGDTITEGGTVEIDTDGPHLIDIGISPQAPIKNDSAVPVEVTVDLGLDEAVKTGEVPDLSYLLSGAGRTPIDIDTINLISTADGHAETWQAVFTLPADSGLAQAETLEFLYSSVDDLDNFSDRVTAANAFQIYQGDLPPLEAPSNFDAVSLPAGHIQLSWNPVDQAVGYVLYRQAPGEAGVSLLTNLGVVTEFTDVLTVDGTYYYAIASVRSENGQQAESGMSTPIDVVSDATAPGVPTDLSLSLAAQGIQAAWIAPPYTEAITYSLYRSDTTEITSVAGLTPVVSGIEEVTATDPHPSESDHCYVVTAVDWVGNESAPSNSFYLNFELLPVGELTVVRVDEEKPVVSWTHSGSSISGYDIYLGPEGSATKLNTERLTQSIYADSGYDGNERRYTVVALDDFDQESLGRSIVLPMLSADLPENAGLKRGLMNRLEYTVINSGTTAIGNALLRVTVEGYEHISESFDIAAGESRVVPVVIGGYSDLPDIATLTTVVEITPNAGEMVRIENSRDIDVGTGMLGLSFTNDEFVRGASGEIVFTLENTGDEKIEIVTAESGGSASAEITLYLSDEEGNILSSAGYTQTFGGNVVTLANGRTIARLAPDAVFESQPMSIAVPSTAPDDVKLTLEISDIYYSQGDPEEVVMDGLRTSRDISLIDTAYYGGIVSVSPEESNGEQDIEIIGQAVARSDGQPLPEVPLKLIITLDDFERSIDVFTGSDGGFTYTFSPTDGEFGDYRVCAVHPDLKDRPIQAHFSILPIGTGSGSMGSTWISYSPAIYQLTSVRNYEHEIAIAVTTGDVATATNLRFVYEAADQAGGVLPQGIHVDTGEPIALPTGTTVTMPITVWADNTADENASLVLRLISDESPGDGLGTVTIDIHISEASPILAYTPDHIETGLALDEMVTETLILGNKGFAPLTDVSVELVNPDGSAAPGWALLNLPTDMDAIEVGDTGEVTLIFSPTETNASEGEYDFYARVSSSNSATVDILIHVSVTNSGIGNVLFKVSDIYTATIDPDTGEVIQGLSGASLTLQNESITSLKYEGNTDEYGELLLSDIPAGRYKYLLTADNHEQVIGRVWIKPGITLTEDVFMGYNLVTVEWSVTETTIQDKYEIVLSATYETDVPAAVVIAEPASISLPEMEPGDVFLGEIRFTNYGLIRADDIEFTLPDSDQYFKYEFLANIPRSIEAKKSITVPYRVTYLAGFSGEDGGGGGGDCYAYGAPACLKYRFECSNGTSFQSSVCVSFTIAWGDCSGGSGGGAGGGGGWWSWWGRGWHWHSWGWGWGWTSWGPPGEDYGNSGSGGYSPPDIVPNGVECWPVVPRKEPPLVDKPTNDDNCTPTNSAVQTLYREYRRNKNDIYVKVPIGTVNFYRSYYNNKWHWNYLDGNLTLVQNAAPGGTEEAGLDSIEKDGIIYERSSSYTDIGIFLNNKHKIVSTEDGYTWKAPDGGWKKYDQSGRMVSHGNRNGTVAKLIYEAGGKWPARRGC